jgi:hypothetical protein
MIAAARARQQCIEAVTQASHSNSVIVQSFQSSLFFITFYNVLNDIDKIMSRTIRSKTHAEMSLVN